ncbi:MAG TPA: GldG family protein [Spirochaetota bacterium]|jgi:ABC-type uncharacterized transport system involved in gliding motility auxiliary subunit|nr:GldG family protein [Spirochaetota bacterium]
MKLDDIFRNLKFNVQSFFELKEKNIFLVLNIIIIVLINIAAAYFPLRIDLTRNKIYSLSQTSKNIVSNLSERLKIKVFFSSDLPAEHAAVSRYLKDLLEEYAIYGNENFSYEIVDEAKLESQATEYGINPVQSSEFSNDQIKLRNVYMGLVFIHGDLIEKIDALTKTVGLEHEITSRIAKMTGKVDALLKLTSPVTVTLYLDSRLKELPIDGINSIEEIVRKAFDKCYSRNYKKLDLRIIDPSQISDLTSLSQHYGISRLRWGNLKGRSGNNIAAGETIFGMVVENGEKFRKIDLEVVPTIFGTNVVSGLEKIEDKINKAVSDLLAVNQRIAYAKGYGIPDINDRRSPEGAAFFANLLSDVYEIVEVDLSREDIPSDINLLIINGPIDKFQDSEKFKIDQFLMNGKSILLFVNSFKELDQRMNFLGNEPSVIAVDNGLDDLLSFYGIDIKKSIVLDKRCTRVNLGTMITDYPLIAMITQEGLDRESPVTKYLNSALMIKASPVEFNDRVKDSSFTKRVLVSTSPESWLMEGMINFNPLFMNPPSDRDLKKYNIALLLEGSFESFYKGKELAFKSQKSAITGESRLEKTISSGVSRLLVVGSSEITTSAFIDYSRKALSGTGNNETFSNDILLHSMVDYLAGNYHIPEMKSKSLDFNPLIKTSDTTRFILKVINIVVVPIFVVITGFVIWRLRMIKRRSIENYYQSRGRL